MTPNCKPVKKLALRRLWSALYSTIMKADEIAVTALRGSRLAIPVSAVTGRAEGIAMIDIASVIAQVLPVTLTLGALVLLARLQREKTSSIRTQRPLQQPVPVRVERDPRER